MKIRQHGKKGTPLADPIEDAKRLLRNKQSREYRARKKALEKAKEQAFGFTSDEDIYGIRPIDERRYKKCFHSGYIGEIPSRKYVIIMTGLSLRQIQILQERTGLSPIPPVGQKEAAKDEKRRWETGDIY